MGKMEDRLFELGKNLASPPSSDDDLYTLLDQIDRILSTVEQSPSPSTWNALQPLMQILTVNKFLRHPDMDVRVAVASCISEITRITAPEAPYDDDVMKNVFQMIVGAFEGLGDMSSRSFEKRVSILETVAKVRSCVVMLDLECDALILDMFHHFLKTISKDHSENIFSSMEAIMTLVIEESEDISSELISGLLNSLKKDKDRQDVLTISQRLAEKVIRNCANKIKSCLEELVQSTHAPLSEYKEVVASICQEDHKEANASGEVLEDDSKFSERTVSDEMPHASAKLDQEVGCPEKVGTSGDTSPIVATSNGTVQMGNGDSMEQPSSPKQNSERSRHNAKSKIDNVDAVAVKPVSRTDTKKTKGRKTNSSGPLMDTAVGSQNDNHKDEQMMTSRGKGHDKESDSLQVNDASIKEAEPSASVAPEKKSDMSDNLPTEGRRNSSQNKKGRRTVSKAAAKISDADAEAERHVSSALKDPLGNSESDGEAIHLKGNKSKGTEDIDEGDPPKRVVSDSDMRPSRNSGKSGQSKRNVDHESSGKRKSNSKKQKKEDVLGKDVDEEQSLKEMASSLKAFSLKTPRVDQTPLDVSAKRKSRKKRAPGTGDASETADCKKEPDASLVGSKIKVWWPDDEMFYEGFVDSYDPDTMKHKINYSDGDVEILLLKDEHYELVKIDIEMDGGKRKAKGSAPQTGMESSSKDAPKPRGRPRSGTSNVGKIFHDDSSGTSKKSKGKDASNDKAKTPKSIGKNKDEPVDETPRIGRLEESGNKSKDESKSKGKDAIIDKARTPKSSRKNDPVDETPKTSDKREKSGNKSKDEGRSKGKDAIIDKAKTPKSSRKNDPVDETPKTSDKREESGNKSKDESKSKGKDAIIDKAKTPKSSRKNDPVDETPKTSNKREESGNRSEDETSKSVKKSKNRTQKANSKFKDGTSKGGGGGGSSSKVGDDESKSKDSTRKDKMPKIGTEASISTPKTGSDPEENDMSAKGKTKAGESENADINVEAVTGAKKRKRKGRK